MSTITREWLQQTIAEYEANREELPFGLDTNSANELQVFKLALASLETEAVYQYWCYTTIENSEGDQEELWFWKDCDKYWFDKIDSKKRMLYAAPPAPLSVPAELTREEYKRRFMEEDDFDATFRGGWNACRSAMLAAAPKQEVK